LSKAVYENVRWLDVFVDYSFRVNMVQRQKDLLNVVTNFLLSFVLYDFVVNGHSVDILCHNVQEFTIIVSLVVFYNTRLVEFA
jgi:hypothetical protein